MSREEAIEMSPRGFGARLVVGLDLTRVAVVLLSVEVHEPPGEVRIINLDNRLAACTAATEIAGREDLVVFAHFGNVEPLDE